MYSRGMSAPPYDQNVGLRTTARARKALSRVMAELEDSGIPKFYGRVVTKEAIINASWLWLESLDPEVIVAAMKEFVPRLEAAMKGAEALREAREAETRPSPDRDEATGKPAKAEAERRKRKTSA